MTLPKCDDCVHGDLYLQNMEIECAGQHPVDFRAPIRQREDWGWFPRKIICRDYHIGPKEQKAS